MKAKKYFPKKRRNFELVKTPFIIGLTGGIGSGKSTVVKIFECFGFAIYHSDTAAKEVYDTDETVRRALIQHFGPSVFQDGVLNRQYLAQRVFKNEDELRQLNQIVHPAVRRHFESFILRTDSKIIVREAAILFESGSHADCQLTITVNCPTNTRLTRVQLRDHLTQEEILARMSNQLTDEQRSERADETIINDGILLVVPQVLAILRKYHLI